MVSTQEWQLPGKAADKPSRPPEGLNVREAA
jgi:hypothetical protein